MVKYVGTDDLRRPQQVPRVSERYRSNADAVWFPPGRRKLIQSRPSSQTVQILDLSIAGALLKGSINPKIHIGMRIRLELNGYEGLVEVRNVRNTSGDVAYYGTAFHLPSDELTAEIFDLVGNARGVDEGMWNRSV